MAVPIITRSDALDRAAQHYRHSLQVAPASPSKVPLLLEALYLATIAPGLPEEAPEDERPVAAVTPIAPEAPSEAEAPAEVEPEPVARKPRASRKPAAEVTE